MYSGLKVVAHGGDVLGSRFVVFRFMRNMNNTVEYGGFKGDWWWSYGRAKVLGWWSEKGGL